MDKKAMEAIREALAKATPGEWLDVDQSDQLCHAIIAKDGPMLSVVCTNVESNDSGLIANAPTWLQQLLDEVERLEKFIENLQDVHEVEKARLKADNEQLQSENEEWKRHYNRLFESKQRLVKSIQSGEKIHFVTLDEQLEGGKKE